MQRTIASAGFVLVLLTLALPWMSFSVGCTGNLASRQGVDLLHGTDANISVHNGNDQADGAVHVDPQPAVWAVLVLAIGGAAAFALKRRWGYWVRAGIAAVTLAVVAAYSAALINGSPGVTFHGTGTRPETQVRPGEFLAAALLVVTLLLNVTLPFVFSARAGGEPRYRLALRIGAYSGGIAVATGLAMWGIVAFVAAAT